MEYNSTQARNGARQGLTPGDRATESTWRHKLSVEDY